MEIYGDIYLLVNSISDFFLLLVCATLLNRRVKKGRIVLSSLTGGLYALLSLYISASPLNFIAGILCSLFMVYIAFGYRNLRMFFTNFALFYLSAFILGGINDALFRILLLPRMSAPVAMLVLILFFLAASLFTAFFGRALKNRFFRRHAELSFTFSGKNYCLTAFCDSGNLMRDKETQLPVVLISRTVFGTELPETSRTISFTTVSGKTVLPLFEPEGLTVNGRACNAAIAVSTSMRFDGCRALIPTALL